MTEGLKFDGGKPRLELLPPSYWVPGSLPHQITSWFYRRAQPLPEVGFDPLPVLEYGAKKYNAFNWCKGMAWSRLVGAALRHCMAPSPGERKWETRDLTELDEESGLPHGAHLACCLLFLREFAAQGIGVNDGPWGEGT